MNGDEFACPSLDGQSAFLRACSDLAALRVKFAGARVARLLRLDRRYREDQPRVPAGNPDGGRWTDEGGGAGATSDGRVRVAQAENERERSSLLARFPEATAAQEARWAVSNAWARDAIARAQERIPGYKPQDSVQETIEGEIDKNEADARDVEAALAAAGEPIRSSPKSLEEVCRPGGSLVGSRSKGSDTDTTTVTKPEFDQLLRDLTNGAQETQPTDSSYPGLWYRRSDETIIGIRRSNSYGLTVDIIDSLNHSGLRAGLRIHQK